MNVFLHICCGPCLLEPLRILRQDYQARVKGFFYNPNIYPLQEYELRKNSVEEAACRLELDVDYNEYDAADYYERTRDAENASQRCGNCLDLRVLKTAQKAGQQGYSHFTTTLLVSPYQEHEEIINAAKKAAAVCGVEFFYYDFRKHFRDGQNLAKNMGLYMQKYCGCRKNK